MQLSSLLKSEIPSYELVLPVTKQKVTYRPFRVKEEKILLLALEEGSLDALVRAGMNLVDSCCDGIQSIGDLPMIDYEYLFIHLRAKSVGEVCEPKIKCPYTGKSSKAKINLMEIKPPDMSGVLDKRIQISDNLGITMKYPCINSVLGVDESLSATEKFMMTVAKSIDEVWTSDETHSTSDRSIEEVVDFVDSLSSDDLKKMCDFVESIPSLTHKVKYFVIDEEKQKKEEYELVLSGIQDFFG